MNKSQTLALSVLLGATLVGGSARADDVLTGFASGAMSRQHGITLPAGVREQTPTARTALGPTTAPERVYGSFVLGGDGVTRPIDGRVAAEPAGSLVALQAEASPAQVSERLFGTFVRVNGIAVPATGVPLAPVIERAVATHTAAAHPAR